MLSPGNYYHQKYMNLESPSQIFYTRLSLFRLLYQNTMNWEAYKQQTFVSYSFGAREVQDCGAGTFCAREKPLPT